MNLYFRNTGTSWADPNNWSDTDGGASAGVIPTDIDDVFFTANSGNAVQDTGILTTIQSLNCTGYTGTLSLDGIVGATSYGINIGGNLTLSAGMRLVANADILLSRIGILVSSNVTTNGVAIPYLMFFGLTTIATLMDTLHVDRLAFATNGAPTFAGSFGFIANSFHNGDPNGRTITLSPGNTYMTGSYTSISNDDATHGKIVSSIPGTMAKFTVTGDEQVAHTDFTDIDASGGRPIYTFKGVVTNCININSFVEPVEQPDRTVAHSFIL